MKRTIIGVLLLIFGFCAANSAPPVDQDETVYQMDWGVMPPGNMWFGGKWSERKLSVTKEDIDRAQYAADLERGSNMIYYGILACVICIVLHGLTSSQHIIAGKFAKVFEWGIVLGLCLIVAGAWLKKAIEYETGIAIAGVVIGGLFLSRKKVREWSLSHLFKGRTVLPAVSEPQTQDNVSLDERECSHDTVSTDVGLDTDPPN